MSDAGHAGGPAVEGGGLRLDERAGLEHLRAVIVVLLLVVLGLIEMLGSRPPARPATP